MALKPAFPHRGSGVCGILEAGALPHSGPRPQGTHALLLDDGLEAVQGPAILGLLHALDLEPHLEGGPSERWAGGAIAPSSPGWH